MSKSWAQNEENRTATIASPSNKDVRRLQRLLKLLAHQNPARFADVDPGIIDGKFGAKTIKAITKFQRLIGEPKNPAITRKLFAQLLTAQAENPAVSTAAKISGPDKCGAGATCESSKRKPIPHKEFAEIRRRPATADRSGRQVARFAQLGSLKDKKRVPVEWERLKKANPKFLKDREPVIETADLGDRGTYYRIMVGPFEQFRQADVFCTALRQKNQSCFVRKRIIPIRRMAEKPISADSAEHESAGQSPQQADSKTTEVGPNRIIRYSEAKESARSANDTKPTGSPQPTSDAAPTPAQTTAITTEADVVPTETGAVAKKDPSAEEDVIATSNKPVTPHPTAPLPAAPEANPSPLQPAPSETKIPTPDIYNKTENPVLANRDETGMRSPPADTAVNADKPAPAVTLPAAAVAQWLARADRLSIQTYFGPSVAAAAAGASFGLLVVVWRQQRRKKLIFDSIGSDSWSNAQDYERERSERMPGNVLDELKTQFESEHLAECRKIRDAFLGNLGRMSETASSNTETSEQAMLVNRKLNQMITLDPAQYKSIFFNWIFLNHAAEMIESSGYSLKRLDPRIQQEFRLLGSLFKIHLLELEARHHVRERLPNVFTTLHQLEA